MNTRTVLLLTAHGLLLAGLSGCAGDAERRALARLQFIMNTGCGGSLEFDEAAADRPVVGVKLEGAEILDAGLRLVGQLHTLRTLNLAEAGRITDHGLSYLRGMTTLEDLNLRATGVTDAAMPHVGTLSNLRQLDLSGNPRVTDEGLVPLRSLSNLLTLKLQDTGVTEQGVKDLKAFLPGTEIVTEVQPAEPLP